MICAEDEARFGLITEVRKCWAPYPIRPVVTKQIKREALYCFACVCPKLGKISALILPKANTEMMQLFLDEVSKEFSDYFVIIQLDRAGWHTSTDLKIPENIRLLFQPSASPQLQPAEHLWDYIRENFFLNKSFSSLDSISDILVDSISSLAKLPDLLRSLTFFPHFRLF